MRPVPTQPSREFLRFACVILVSFRPVTSCANVCTLYRLTCSNTIVGETPGSKIGGNLRRFANASTLDAVVRLPQIYSRKTRFHVGGGLSSRQAGLFAQPAVLCDIGN